jgi:hypothetical protein
MTDTLSIDYSFARPDPAAIRAAGYGGVWRYLSTDPDKSLGKEEAAALHAAGLGIGLVWESTAQRSLEGAQAGTDDGITAAEQARALGVPDGCPLLVAVADFAATPDQVGTIHDYYFHFRSQVMGWQYGGYGTGYVIDALVAAGAEGLWWQSAEDDQGTSGGKVSPNASIYQRVTPTGEINVDGETRKVASPALLPSGDFDEDVECFGPAQVNWWTADSARKPAPATPPAPVKATVTKDEAASALATLTAYIGQG